ncbi:MAG: hypothetical protein HY817_00900 [Candidatus Abawacabacteria bacterium]|nr:hypothetical protein [Candidatus Abawacabacteria bacterium]
MYVQHQLQSMITIVKVWYQLILKTSFFSIIGILIGGTILNVQEGSLFAFDLALFYLYWSLVIPLWLLGQHWVSLIPVAFTYQSDIVPLSNTLGVYIILFSLIINLLLLIYHGPKVIFTLYFFFTGQANPIGSSIQLTKSRYVYLALRIGLIVLPCLLIQSILPIVTNAVIQLFVPLYSEIYIATSSYGQILSSIVATLFTSIITTVYFYHLWQEEIHLQKKS